MNLFLPTDGTADQVLSTHADGTVYWADNSTGSVVTVTSGNTNEIVIGGTTSNPTVSWATSVVHDGSLLLTDTGDTTTRTNIDGGNVVIDDTAFTGIQIVASNSQIALEDGSNTTTLTSIVVQVADSASHSIALNYDGSISLAGSEGSASSVLTSQGSSAQTIWTASSPSAVAGTFVTRDGNANSSFSNINYSQTTITSDGTTVTLSVSSTRLQRLTGTMDMTYVLPDATTLPNGWIIELNNDSTGSLPIQDNGLDLLYTIPAGGYVKIILTDNGSTNGSWDGYPSPPDTITWGTDALTTTTSIVLDNGSNTTTITPTGIVNGTMNLFLPTDGTADQVLSTHADGTVYWADNSVGSVTSVSGTANQIAITGTSSVPIVGFPTTGISYSQNIEVTNSTDSITLNPNGTLTVYDGTHTTTVQGSGIVNGTMDLFLPTDGTVDQVLATHANGTVYWADNSSGSITAVSGTANQIAITGTSSVPIVGFPTTGISYSQNIEVTNSTDSITLNPNGTLTVYDGTHTTTVQGSGIVNGTMDLFLPTDGTVDQVLATHANGTVYWADNSSGSITAVNGTSGNITSSTSSGVVTLNLATAGTAGTYTNSTITTDAYGRVTGASSGATAITSVGGTSNEIVVTTTGTSAIVSLPSTGIAYNQNIVLANGSHDPITLDALVGTIHVDSFSSGVNKSVINSSTYTATLSPFSASIGVTGLAAEVILQDSTYTNGITHQTIQIANGAYTGNLSSLQMFITDGINTGTVTPTTISIIDGTMTNTLTKTNETISNSTNTGEFTASELTFTTTPSGTSNTINNTSVIITDGSYNNIIQKNNIVLEEGGNTTTIDSTQVKVTDGANSVELYKQGQILIGGNTGTNNQIIVSTGASTSAIYANYWNYLAGTLSIYFGTATKTIPVYISQPNLLGHVNTTMELDFGTTPFAWTGGSLNFIRTSLLSSIGTYPTNFDPSPICGTGVQCGQILASTWVSGSQTAEYILSAFVAETTVGNGYRLYFTSSGNFTSTGSFLLGSAQSTITAGFKVGGFSLTW